jgi:heptosyltransferase-2
MTVPQALVTEAASQLGHLPRPRFALAIGSSVPEKSWGHEKFVALAKALIARGWGVLVLGGPGEKTVAERFFSQVSAAQPGSLYVMCQGSVLKSAAALKNCDFCIGNDTGILNVAVAVDISALGLFGATRPLAHDPLMYGISGTDMESITVEAVLDRLDQLTAVAPAGSKY